MDILDILDDVNSDFDWEETLNNIEEWVKCIIRRLAKSLIRSNT